MTLITPQLLAGKSREELIELEQELIAYEARARRENAHKNFIPFVKEMWPGFIEGRHHKMVAKAFERVMAGELKRVIINMAPRHTKSEFASFLLPAWYLGNNPGKKVIQASHTGELSVGFGRKVRNLVDSEPYRKIFNTELQADSKAAGRWNTSEGGEYFAIGVGGAVTGKGADLLIIDDPHSEQEAMIGQYNPATYDKAYEWYTTGPRQRLQPGGAIIIVMTRWSKRDLTGRLIDKSIIDGKASEWTVIELPAILPSGEAMWPEFWSKEELAAVKADIPVGRWNAQYMQTPTSEEGAILKRDWWQRWKEPKAPICESVLVSWDTAFEKTQRSDYSACTTWGIFSMVGKDGHKHQNLILLDGFKDKMEFPELKRVAKQHYRDWEPDMVVIEQKASGSPLIYELRAVGIPVTEFKPTKNADKIARANAVSDMFRSGFVWAPETKWADEIIEECAEFPNGAHDDYVDSVTQALLRIRGGGLLLASDDDTDAAEDGLIPTEYY